MKLYPTANDLNSNTKTAAVELLNARLADAIDLALLTKQAQFNLKGPHFIALNYIIYGYRTEIYTNV